jgi:hypothetical protein
LRAELWASLEPFDCVQVIASLMVSCIMLGVKATSLNAVIRTTNRKQELTMLVGELTRVRSSNIPAELLQRAGSADELSPEDDKTSTMVCALCSSVARGLSATSESFGAVQ